MIFFFTNFAKTIGGGRMVCNSKEPQCGMLIRFLYNIEF